MFNKFACTAALLAAMPLSAPAAGLDFLLKIDGIKGESQEMAHEDEIDITCWPWGMSNASSPVLGGGGGASKPVFQDFSWSRGIDRSIPPVFLAVATGQHIRSAQLDVVRLGQDPTVFFELNVEDVLTSNLQLDEAGPDQSALGRLGFSKVTLRYRPQMADGSYAGWIEGSSDLKTNTPRFTGGPGVLLGLGSAGGSPALAVPEPPSWALMLGGLLVAGAWLQRRGAG